MEMPSKMLKRKRFGRFIHRISHTHYSVAIRLRKVRNNVNRACVFCYMKRTLASPYMCPKIHIIVISWNNPQLNWTQNFESLLPVCFQNGLKRKSIEDEFIKARRPLPARYVLRNEIARLRRNDTVTDSITLTELHNLLSQHTAIPDDDFTAYVLDHQIDDKDEIRFNFVVSCKKLLELNMESRVCNADTTYKLIWQGYPVGVTGHTDYNKKFHPTSISVSTNEDENDFAFLFAAIKQGTKDALIVIGNHQY